MTELPRVFSSVHIHFVCLCLALQTYSTLQTIPSLPYVHSYRFAGSESSSMALVPAPARSRGSHANKQRFSPKAHAQSTGNRYKHTDAPTKPEQSHQVDGRTFSQDSSGLDAGGLADSSGRGANRASQPGKNSARIFNSLHQEDDLPATSTSSEILAHAIVRGFRIKTARRLPKFLQRRSSPRNAPIESWVQIKEVIYNQNLLSFFAC